MKAIQVKQPGGPEALELVDIPVPQPKPSEAVVKVAAAGVNFIDLADFYFRSLIVDDIWIPLGENMMIEQFKPVWNLVIDGFGNKDPGMRRATQYRSPWDALHPGRQFAKKLASGENTSKMQTRRLKDYFAGQIVPLVSAEDATDIGTTEDEEE